ncbi:MAG: DedA family protein [Candidatus Eremiobacteraeota bacterium]|nr:DedA family protein [Candidatus Eremiobacteraeota bacterium]
MEALTNFFSHIAEAFGFPGLFLVMMVGNVGIPVGTEFVLLLAGGVAQSVYHSAWWSVAIVATVAEVVGGLILYTAGYYGGRPFVARWGKYVKLSEKKLDRFHEFYERYGNIVVFVCRFLPIVRGVSALPAGVSRMQKRYFILYTLLGSACFCFGLTYLGSVFGSHLDQIGAQVHRWLYALVALMAIAAMAYVGYRYASRRSKGAG